jgi:hypothetical protein
VPHEQRRFLHAVARSLPWAVAAVVVTIGLCALLGAPRWAASIAVPTVALAVPLAYAREGLRAIRGGATRSQLAVVAAHVALPLVGVPLAVEGLRSDDRPLAIVGTALLACVVLNAAIVLPWLTARRQRRGRAR